MRLIPVPKDKYEDYRLDVIFKGYKWDPQYLDNNTISRYVLVITEQEHLELERLTEQLAEETVMAERLLIAEPGTTKPLMLPRKIHRELRSIKNYRAEDHLRLMRFDFHPLDTGGWALSEVNSDVPGGLAEASLLTGIALELLGDNSYWYKDFGDTLIKAISGKVKTNGCVMMVHCTSYSDDRQVMQFVGDRLSKTGYTVIYGAADHIRFTNGRAFCILGGNNSEIDLIFRFTPVEWLIGIKPKRWQGYFDTVTASCNHPAAIFAQTKRFPFVWDRLEQYGIKMTAWRELLPETLEVKDARVDEEFIYKPVYGRVGEGISIREACSNDEYTKILKDVKRHPKRYIAQRQFFGSSLTGSDGTGHHICIGSYSVEGKAAGYYARISKSPRIDSNAADIPVLIERIVK